MKSFALVLLAGLSFFVTPAHAEQAPNFVFCCEPKNDLFLVLGGEKSGFARYASPMEAVLAAKGGAGVLILADGYPEKTTILEPSIFTLAAEKKLRLYVEYPSALPNVEIGAPQDIKLERGVVQSNYFGDALPPMRIVMINGCRYLPMKLVAEKQADSASQAGAIVPHLALARVAGVDTAVFGLENTPTQPAIFEHPCGNLLVATTKLSNFVSGRYMPHDAWRSIWRTILGRLQPGTTVPAIDWTPTVRPSYTRGEKLPDDVEARALRRSADWIVGTRILRHEKWPQEVLDRALRYNTVRDMPSPDWPKGDGSFGILEGYSSTIRADGSQPMRYAVRNDNMCEVAMLLSLDSALRDRPRHREIALNILDYIYAKSGLALGNRTDPAKPEYGLVGWSLDMPNSYWSDDNGRALLSMLAVSAICKTKKGGESNTDRRDEFRWDDAMARFILADFRTTGQYGFREDCIFAENLQKNGWRYYWDGKYVKYSPHYVGWLWPCYLWAYEKSKFEPLLARTETGIRMMMEAYPKKWDWCNRSGSIERARLLLPLAWLVRVKDTPEHREWLRTVARDLIAVQDASGAIRETIGGGAHGTLTNAEYGTCETSLIQTDGDPVADMLYTCNFAIIGLHEAAAATGEPLYAEAEEKLAKFLCRIQIRSEAHPELDGAWYRAFNTGNWEYWASNADWEWGPWCTEVGWTQPWIAGTLALRQMKTSLWDLTQQVPLSKDFDRFRQEMLPDDVLKSGDSEKK